MARTKEPHEQVQRLARKRWGDEWMSQLAEHVGVSQRTVRRWSNGETRVPAAVLQLLTTEAAAAA